MTIWRTKSSTGTRYYLAGKRIKQWEYNALVREYPLDCLLTTIVNGVIRHSAELRGYA